MTKTIIWAAIAAAFAVTISGVLIFSLLQDVEAKPPITGAPNVPIGTVIDWFCVDPCTIPHGFAFADGSVVDDPSSPLDGVTLPDLEPGTFVRGAATTDDVGDTGGSPGGHTHSVDPPNTETTSDFHDHQLIVGDTGESFGNDSDSPAGCLGDVTPLVCNFVAAPNHHHSGGNLRLGSAGTFHTHFVDVLPFDSAPSDDLPPFVDLVKIIRIK